MNATAVLWGFVVVSFRQARAYVGAAALRLIQYPVKLVVMYYLWRAVLQSSTATLPQSLERITGYYAVALLIGQFFPFYRVARQTEADIQNHTIDLNLCRPVPYWVRPLAPLMLASFGYFVAALPVGMLVLAALGVPLPHAVDLGAFALSLGIGIPMRFLLWLCLGLTAFWTESTQGAQSIFGWLEALASGALVPFSLLPGSIARWLSFLPFQSYVSLPVEASMGTISLQQYAARLGVSILWALVFAGLAAALWRRGTRVYQSGGG